MAALSLDGLTKYYGDVRGVEDLSIDVPSGEVFGLLGPNGAGKTTTIRTLLGFLQPTRGTATALGHDMTDEAASIEARHRIGYLPSDPGLDPGATVSRFLDLQAAFKGDARRAALVDRFGLATERRIRELSRGNRQKVAVVQAFMHEPDLLVLDEPTSGLDPLLQEEFLALVDETVARGATVLFSSHVLGEVQRACDRVGVLRDGRLAAVESVEDLLERGGKRVAVTVAKDVDAGAFALAGVHDLRVGDAVRFTYTGSYDALLDHLRSFTVLDLDVSDAPLEDVFMRFYDRGEAGRDAEPATERGAGPGGEDEADAVGEGPVDAADGGETDAADEGATDG